MENKKTYLCPAQKVLKIETGHLLIPKSDSEGDQQLSKGYSSNIWAAMSADDNASSKQADEEDDF